MSLTANRASRDVASRATIAFAVNVADAIRKGARAAATELVNKRRTGDLCQMFPFALDDRGATLMAFDKNACGTFGFAVTSIIA